MVERIKSMLLGKKREQERFTPWGEDTSVPEDGSWAGAPLDAAANQRLISPTTSQSHKPPLNFQPLSGNPQIDKNDISKSLNSQ